MHIDGVDASNLASCRQVQTMTKAVPLQVGGGCEPDTNRLAVDMRSNCGRGGRLEAAVNSVDTVVCEISVCIRR
jgi:hypothetical protein